MKKIDLRSDTVTLPTPEMMQAIANAKLGDDVFGDDIEVLELEALAATLLRKEAALFVPSGTFGNQLALMSHTNSGDEVILDQECHIVLHETAASSQLAKVQLFTLESKDGLWDLEKLKRIIKPGDMFSPKTALICIENAYNGTVLPVEYMKNVFDIARTHNILVHLDGARLFNAAITLGVEPHELSCHADSINICLSKGLCSPVGSILVGSKEMITRARRFRKMMGGAMRQVGVLAAPGKISLTKMRLRLWEDHELREYMESKLEKFPFIRINKTHNKINLLFFDILHPKAKQLAQALEQFNIWIVPEEKAFRFAAHHGLNSSDIDFVVEKMEKFFQDA